MVIIMTLERIVNMNSIPWRTGESLLVPGISLGRGRESENKNYSVLFPYSPGPSRIPRATFIRQCSSVLEQELVKVLRVYRNV